MVLLYIIVWSVLCAFGSLRLTFEISCSHNTTTTWIRTPLHSAARRDHQNYKHILEYYGIHIIK